MTSLGIVLQADDLQDLLSTSSSEHTLEPFSSLDTLGGEQTSGTGTGTSSDPPFMRDSPPGLDATASLGNWGSVTTPGAASTSRLGTLAETMGTWGTSAAGTSNMGKISEGPNPFAQRPATAPALGAGDNETAEAGTSRQGVRRSWRWNAGISAEISAAAAEVAPAGPSSARSAPGEDSFVVPSAWGRTAQ